MDFGFCMTDVLVLGCALKPSYIDKVLAQTNEGPTAELGRFNQAPFAEDLGMDNSEITGSQVYIHSGCVALCIIPLFPPLPDRMMRRGEHVGPRSDIC